MPIVLDRRDAVIFGAGIAFGAFFALVFSLAFGSPYGMAGMIGGSLLGIVLAIRLTHTPRWRQRATEAEDGS